ncbi:MAG: hypothetical protein KDK45_09385 [Leptospiraceae bacterium]|nr:hypothetical protein [Leptospiraceae bacterium]
MSIARAIVDAFLSEYPIHFATEGIVKTVKDESCDVALQNNKKVVYKNVKWYSLIKPQVGSKCLLVFRDNKEERVTACQFDKLDEIDTPIGKLSNISISDEGIEISFNSMAKIKLNPTSVQAMLGSKSIEITSTKMKLTGDVEIDGKLNVTKNIESDEDVKAGSISLKTHTHPYTDTPIGPSMTQAPQ